MISQIFANLPPKLYMDFIMTMRVMGLNNYNLKRVIVELKEKWKQDIKSKDGDKDTESKALNISDSR
jgi:hypothetical protein